MRTLRVPQLVVVVGAGVLLVASVLSFARSGDEPAAAETAAGSTVAIVDFAYDPEELTAAVGDTVVWTNEDSAAHTVTSDGEGPLASEELEQGATYEATFDAAGTYTYICTIHPTMRGTVEVSS